MKAILPIITICIITLSCSNSQNPEIDQDNSITNTNVIVEWDSSYKLNSSSAFLVTDNLYLTLNDSAYRINGFDIELKNNSSQWKASLSQPGLLDCLFVSSQFRVLSQSIRLNKLQYKKGDQLKGDLDLLILGRKSFFREPAIQFVDNRKWDTIRMKGVLSAVID